MGCEGMGSSAVGILSDSTEFWIWLAQRNDKFLAADKGNDGLQARGTSMTQQTLFQQARARRSDPETSHKAAAHVTPALTKIQQMILADAVVMNRGFTDEHLEQLYSHLAPSTVRTRRSELVKMGKLRDSGRTILNKRGHECTIWELAP